MEFLTQNGSSTSSDENLELDPRQVRQVFWSLIAKQIQPNFLRGVHLLKLLFDRSVSEVKPYFNGALPKRIINVQELIPR